MHLFSTVIVWQIPNWVFGLSQQKCEIAMTKLFISHIFTCTTLSESPSLKYKDLFSFLLSDATDFCWQAIKRVFCPEELNVAFLKIYVALAQGGYCKMMRLRRRECRYWHSGLPYFKQLFNGMFAMRNSFVLLYMTHLWSLQIPALFACSNA